MIGLTEYVVNTERARMEERFESRIQPVQPRASIRRWTSQHLANVRWTRVFHRLPA